jgi:hypothetical protein
MYVVVLSDIELGLIESLHVGTTLSGTPTGTPSIPATLTLTLPLISCVVQVLQRNASPWQMARPW